MSPSHQVATRVRLITWLAVEETFITKSIRPDETIDPGHFHDFVPFRCSLRSDPSVFLILFPLQRYSFLNKPWKNNSKAASKETERRSCRVCYNVNWPSSRFEPPSCVADAGFRRRAAQHRCRRCPMNRRFGNVAWKSCRWCGIMKRTHFQVMSVWILSLNTR